MSDSLRELYQEMILDHGRHPRNFGPMPTATHQQEGYNPLCGDQVKIYIHENEGVLDSLSFEGKGCAISMASASLLTECLKGKTRAELQVIFSKFLNLVTQGTACDSLGKLSVLAGVQEFPARVKCATLAWHTLLAALEGKN